MRSFLDEATRWNTSCCGIEPNIIVIHAAVNQSISFNSGAGNRLNFPASDAWLSTVPTPPTMPLTSTAMYTMPTRITIIWMKSVTATDHMPPHMV